MITRIAGLRLAVVILLAVTARAHDGHDHTIMGTVTARDAKHLKVQTPSGEVLSIALNEKTIVKRGKQKGTVNDVQKGRRVVVNIGNGEDPLIAREIQLGVTKVTEP